MNSVAPETSRRPVAGHLPLQNLLLAAVVTASTSGGALLLNAQTGFPFGSGRLAESVGPIGAVGWSAGQVLAAVVALLSARGVAKLLLLPHRSNRRYGYWLLAVTAALATLPPACLDLFATGAMHWRRWTSAGWSWEGIALPNLAGSFAVSVAALLLATPALIDKRPVQPPPGLLPVAIWIALNAACLAGCVSHASDAALAALVAPVLVVTMLALQRHRRAVGNCGGSTVSR